MGGENDCVISFVSVLNLVFSEQCVIITGVLDAH